MATARRTFPKSSIHLFTLFHQTPAALTEIVGCSPLSDQHFLKLSAVRDQNPIVFTTKRSAPQDGDFTYALNMWRFLHVCEAAGWDAQRGHVGRGILCPNVGQPHSPHLYAVRHCHYVLPHQLTDFLGRSAYCLGQGGLGAVYKLVDCVVCSHKKWVNSLLHLLLRRKIF